MAIPQLNMDGYLLKQIKAETARANAADEALQAQITELSQGYIESQDATVENGWRMIDLDELIYWGGSAGAANYKSVGYTGVEPQIKKIGGLTALQFLSLNTSISYLPWSDTGFNKGKAYLAVIGYQTTVTIGGGRDCYFEASLEIRYADDSRSTDFRSAYTHTQNVITNNNPTRCDFIAFSKPFLIKKAGQELGHNVQMFVKQWVDGEAADIGIKMYNPYDLSDQRNNCIGMNLYVNFPKDTTD